MNASETATPTTWGYARVSTRHQAREGTSLEEQKARLRAAGARVVFSDATTGTNANRAGLIALRDTVQPGDTILVTSLDRLGRSLADMAAVSQEMTERGVTVRSLRDGIDTSSPMGRAQFGMLAAMAEWEHALIIDRTESGRAAAAAQGRVGGRPARWSKSMSRRARRLMAQGVSKGDVATMLGIGRTTLYKHLKQEDEETAAREAAERGEIESHRPLRKSDSAR